MAAGRAWEGDLVPISAHDLRAHAPHPSAGAGRGGVRGNGRCAAEGWVIGPLIRLFVR